MPHLRQTWLVSLPGTTHIYRKATSKCPLTTRRQLLFYIECRHGLYTDVSLYIYICIYIYILIGCLVESNREIALCLAVQCMCVCAGGLIVEWDLV